LLKINFGCVDERFNEWRITENQIPITGPEDLERVLQFFLVGTDRLQNADVDQRHRNIHSGGPWTKRETVKQDATAVAINQLIVELQDPLNIFTFFRAPHPVVWHA
jgi:hypothetical protein